MTTNKTARFLGALFLVDVLANVIGSILYNYVLVEQNFANLAALGTVQAVIGILLNLIGMISVLIAGVITLLLFKQRYKSTSYLFFSFRIGEFILSVILMGILLSVISLVQNPINLHAGQTESVNSVVKVLIHLHHGIEHMNYLTFSIAFIFFYILFYRTKLVPRFISAWGMIVTIIIFPLTILTMLGFNTGSSTDFFLLYIQLSINVIFMGIWLLTKGFNKDSILTK